MARGTNIVGWWAFWPWHGEEYARVFKTKEDAEGYIPNIKTKHGKPFPLGEKHVMRVAWDVGKHRWSNDEPIVYSQDEVEKQFLAQGELNAAAERPAA